MLEFIVLMLVLVTMALTGFTVLAMLLVSGVFVLFGALAGAGAGGVLVAQQQAKAVEHLPLSLPAIESFLGRCSQRPFLWWKRLVQGDGSMGAVSALS